MLIHQQNSYAPHSKQCTSHHETKTRVPVNRVKILPVLSTCGLGQDTNILRWKLYVCSVSQSFICNIMMAGFDATDVTTVSLEHTFVMCDRLQWVIVPLKIPKWREQNHEERFKLCLLLRVFSKISEWIVQNQTMAYRKFIYVELCSEFLWIIKTLWWNITVEITIQRN